MRNVCLEYENLLEYESMFGIWEILKFFKQYLFKEGVVQRTQPRTDPVALTNEYCGVVS